jgi:hypothetical protein
MDDCFSHPTDEENEGGSEQIEGGDWEECNDITAIISVVRTKPEEATQAERVEHLISWKAGLIAISSMIFG